MAAKKALEEIRQYSVDQGKQCIEQIKKYIKNLADNPDNVRFKKIAKSMPTFKNSVEKVKGGIELLQSAGFTNAADKLEITSIVNVPVLKEILTLL